MANVQISIIDSDISTTTDANGLYQISAEPRDVVKYTYPGLSDVQIMVEDVTRILNIEMTQKIEQLDEVTVRNSNRKSQNELEEEYKYKPNLIKTAFGILDSETAPGKIRFLQEDEITASWPFVAVVLASVWRKSVPFPTSSPLWPRGFLLFHFCLIFAHKTNGVTTEEQSDGVVFV